MSVYKLSVIIPVKNGAATLAKCLESICQQTIANQLEIIVMDSGSTDSSIKIAKDFKASIITIAPETFDHGVTRNKGVEHATGEFIYLTVQDAWLSKNDLLEKMLQHFEQEEVKAVVGHQAVPHERDKNPLEWYRPVSAPTVTVKQIKDPAKFLQMPQQVQQALVAWDDVVAMYRKAALLEQPFKKTAFAEDWIWSYQALLKGWRLIHDSSIVVYHYHHHSFDYSFRTTYTINYHFYQFFGYIPSAHLPVLKLLRVTFHLAKNKGLGPAEKSYWIKYNFLKSTANFLSNLNFLIRLKAGGNSAVENGYNKYCKSIPQGKQKKQEMKFYQE